ncbi:MAG: hypothetical protein WA851_09635 [Xanthobacteraceae bacterium]
MSRSALRFWQCSQLKIAAHKSDSERSETKKPADGGVLSDLRLARVLAGLLGRLLRLLLLSRVLRRLLLTLLAWLVALTTALLRLAFVVLIHIHSLQEFAEKSFECTSLKQQPYMATIRHKHRGRRSLFQNKIRSH